MVRLRSPTIAQRPARLKLEELVYELVQQLVIPNITAMNRPICFVENVVTDKDHRKQGLAKKVIEKAVEFARQHKCYKVILQSGIARKEAHQFYEKLGFNGNSKKAFDMRLKY